MGDFTNGSEYDPDLEARLYGEIYYSNETFPEQNPLNVLGNLSLQQTVNQSYPSQNNCPSSEYAYDLAINSESYHWRTNSESERNASVLRNLPSTSHKGDSSFRYSKSFSQRRYHNKNFSNADYSNHYRNYYYSLNKDDYGSKSRRNAKDYQQMVASFRPRQRISHTRNGHREQNTSRNVFVPDRTEKTSRDSRNSRRIESPKTSRIQKSPEKSVKIIDDSQQKSPDNSIEIIDDNNKKSNEVADDTSTEIITSVDVSEKKIVINNKNDKDIDNKVDTVQYSSVTASKYDVMEKQNQTESVDIIIMNNNLVECSDSEESIFEVPIPPKPKPPIINLRDSGDSSSSEEAEEEEESPVILLSDERSPDLSPTNQDSNVQSDQQTIDSANADNTEKEFTDVDIDQGNIILNCIELQRCASTLGDIRRIRESGIGSDDSMTDSEALNWGTIEGQIVKEGHTIPDEDSNHGHVSVNNPNKFHNNEKSQNVSENTTNCSDKISTIKSAQAADSPKIHRTRNLLEPTNNVVIQDQSDIVINSNDKGNDVEKEKSPSSRSEKLKKRANNDKSIENVINCSRNNPESSTSAKRSKKSIKSTAELSFEEYVFQPMPKKLQKFYSMFRGEEFMKDVTFLQNQMPKNPNRWAILDIDILGPKRLGKNIRCAICQNVGHKKDRCPEKRQLVVCYMCGEYGHYEPRCPYKMCLTCGTKYSTYRKTCEFCRNLICTTCKSQGHLNTNCPDLWRRFHQTTQSYNVNAPANPQDLIRTPNKLACCNCAKRGHESSTCTKYQWSQHFPTPRFITNYNQPPLYASNRVVYHDTNYATSSETITWVTEEIYPHTIAGVSYAFTEGCSLTIPTFLKNHIPSEVLFDVTITGSSNNFVILVKTINDNILYRLKQLIIQWLQRKPEDRNYMINMSPLPVKQLELADDLEKKWMKFKSYKFQNTSNWLTTMKKLDDQIKEREGIYKPKLTKKKLVRKRLGVFKKKLVAFTYIKSAAPNANRILALFQELLTEVQSLPIVYSSHVPLDLYLAAIWYNFELFTPHFSDYIVMAAQKHYGYKINVVTNKKCEANKNRNKAMKKKVEKRSEVNDAQIIDLTHNDDEDEDSSVILNKLDDEDIHVNDKIVKNRKQKVKNHSEKNHNKKIMANKKIWSKNNNILRGKNELNCHQQLKCANEILKYVEKNNLSKFMKKANKLVDQAHLSLLRKNHILQFWTLLRTVTAKEFRIPPNS